MRLMRTAALALLALLSVHAFAQTYKCVDENKRVTYSNTSCDKQGLKDAGPVADRLMTVPAAQAPKAAPRKDAGKAPPRTTAEDMDEGRLGAGVKPVVPLMEKLAK